MGAYLPLPYLSWSLRLNLWYREAELTEWVWAVQKAIEYLQGRGESDVKENRKAGYLMKKGGKRHNWKKRWFVLNDKRLRCVFLRVNCL